MGVLKRGMYDNADVKAMQDKLQKLGYDIGADGDFGPKTETALRDFQKKSNIGLDGEHGDETMRTLDAKVAAKAAMEDGAVVALPKPAPTPAKPKVAAGVVGGALNDDTLPQGASDKEGRYRLVTVNAQATGPHSRRRVESEMVLMDPDGDVVWRGKLVSGGWGKKGGALPGMTDDLPASYDSQQIITEYKINYEGSGPRPKRPTFRYATEETGFFYHLLNPNNIAELGGANRGDFGIHPGGQRLTSQGTPVMSAGCLKLVKDADARSFDAILKSLPKDQRPLSLEIANENFVGRDVQMAVRGETAPQRYAARDVGPNGTLPQDKPPSIGEMMTNLRANIGI